MPDSLGFLNPIPYSAKEFLLDGVEIFLILDYDGVLNPDYSNGTFSKYYFSPDNRARVENHDYTGRKHSTPYGYMVKEPKSYAIQWSSELIARMNSVTSSSTVQTIVLSTWRHQLSDPIAKMGLTSAREIFYLPWGADRHADDYFKGEALKNFLKDSSSVKASRKLVWIDDQVLKESKPAYRHGLPAPEFDGSNSLLFAPQEMYGISRLEMERLENFVKS